MFRALAAFALLAACAAPDLGQPLPVHTGGRMIADSDGRLRSGWPGVYFEGRFNGTGVTVRLDPKRERVRLLVDGVEQPVTDGTTEMTVTGLKPGPHNVRLERLSESQPGELVFTGFYPLNGTALPAPEPRARRIEFIGDSHTVGYGDTSPTRDCDGAKVHATTDSQQAFGPVLAKRLDADYRLIAYSGYGVVRNYGGHLPGESLPGIYARVTPGDPETIAVDGWKPQLIVIYLGTNDFSTPVHPGEAWRDRAALSAAWQARYLEFLSLLARAQPQARFLLIGGPSFQRDLEGLRSALDAAMVRRVRIVAEPKMEMTGCNWHPSLKDHRALADVVEGAIRDWPGLWD